MPSGVGRGEVCVVALADVGQRPRRVVRVESDEQVGAGAPDILPLAELVELGARRDQHLAGPVADLGEEDAGGLAVGEEETRTHSSSPPTVATPTAFQCEPVRPHARDQVLRHAPRTGWPAERKSGLTHSRSRASGSLAAESPVTSSQSTYRCR